MHYFRQIASVYTFMSSSLTTIHSWLVLIPSSQEIFMFGGDDNIRH